MGIYNVGITPSTISFAKHNKAYVCNNNAYGIAGSSNVTVLDLKTKLPLMTINDPSFNLPYMCLIVGNKVYVANSGGSTLSVIDIHTNQVVEVIDGFNSPIMIVALKDVLYVVNYGYGSGNTISVYNLISKTITNTITVGLAPIDLVLSLDKKFLYCLNYVDGNINTGTIDIISVQTNTVVNILSNIQLFGPFNMVLSKKNLLYVANFGSNNFSPYGTTVSVIDMKTNTNIKNISTGIQPSGICLSEDEKKLYVSNYNALYAGPSYTNLTFGTGSISVIDTKKLKLKDTLECVKTPTFLAINKNKLYVISYNGNIVQTIKLE